MMASRQAAHRQPLHRLKMAWKKENEAAGQTDPSGETEEDRLD